MTRGQRLPLEPTQRSGNRMADTMTDILREFLLETMENLTQLDADLLTLEKKPSDRNTLARVFRTLHSVKGTAGFIGLVKLQALTHAAESLLSKIRGGEMPFSRPVANALLGVIDGIRQILAAIEASGEEGPDDYTTLVSELERLRGTNGADSLTEVPNGLPPPVSSLPTAAPEPLSLPSGLIRVELPSGTADTDAHPPEPAELADARPGALADSSIRVDVGLLDKLMTLVGELVLARNQIVQDAATREDSPILGAVQRLNLLTSELQASVMKTRMQPISTLWAKFPRVVRDMAVACQKKVRLETDGHGTELDKTILESIRDPLTHLLRNAVDHGIEPPEFRIARGKPAEGRLFLHAYHEGGKVVVELADDGGGIDPAKIRAKAVRSQLLSAADVSRLSDADTLQLLFLPGFSTAETVTQFSGRGVGMDVVRTNVEQVGGTVDIVSLLGSGTTIKMKIPLTLAIIPALSVSCAGEQYCIPQENLLELVRLEPELIDRRIENVHGAAVYRLRGNLLPLLDLGRELRVSATRQPGVGAFIVVLQADDREFGLVVDAIHDTQEIVVKPLQKQHKGVGAFAGATITGDGRVALILDVLGLAHRAGVSFARRVRATITTATAPPAESVLIFAGSDGARMAIPLRNVARLELFTPEAIERVGRRRVVRYRDGILPVFDVSRELRRMAGGPTVRRGRAKGPRAMAATGSPVIVCGDGSRRAGLLVREILDITQEAVTARSPASRPGVLFDAVVQGRVAEFLDVPRLLQAVAEQAS